MTIYLSSIKMVKHFSSFTFQLLHTHIILLVSICNVNCDVAHTHEVTRSFLSYFQYIHFDGVTTTSSCPDNGRNFIIGARLRTSNFLNLSYPTVTAMEFICSDAISTRAPAKGTLFFQKNIGNWTTMSFCPNGAFVTGMTLYMQVLSNQNLMHEENSQNLTEQRSLGNFDIFDLGKSCYISGVGLNCSWNIDHKNDYDGLLEEGNQMKHPAIPPWRSKVTLGTHSRTGLRLYCTEGRAVSAVALEQEALVTYEDGERWVPMRVSTSCTIITNPVTHCSPEVDWEKIENVSCSDSSTGNDVDLSNNKTNLNISCNVPHFVGVSPNTNIENLKTILRAYQQIDLDGMETKKYLRSKLFSTQFVQDWQQKYKLNISDYKTAIENRDIHTYLQWTQENTTVNYFNVNFKEPEYCRLIRNSENGSNEEPLKFEFNVKQLVGFCSIYKIHFPLFRHQFYKYFERKIDGIMTRIIFPEVDENTNVDEMLNRKKLS